MQEYRIERVLGFGGFGITYLAIDTNLDKTVARQDPYRPLSGQKYHDYSDAFLRAVDGPRASTSMGGGNPSPISTAPGSATTPMVRNTQAR